MARSRSCTMKTETNSQMRSRILLPASPPGSFIGMQIMASYLVMMDECILPLEQLLTVPRKLIGMLPQYYRLSRMAAICALMQLGYEIHIAWLSTAKAIFLQQRMVLTLLSSRRVMS